MRELVLTLLFFLFPSFFFCAGLKLTVDVESPSVLLPSSPTKSDVLIAELGHFSLSNHYVVKEDGEYVHVVTGYPNILA